MKADSRTFDEILDDIEEANSSLTGTKSPSKKIEMLINALRTFDTHTKVAMKAIEEAHPGSGAVGMYEEIKEIVSREMEGE